MEQLFFLTRKYSILVCVILMLGCTSKDIKKIYYPSGALEVSYELLKGKKNGLSHYYYETGELRNVASWEKGLQNGLAKNYYKSGKIKSEANYSNGLREGKSIIYYENGKLKNIVNWKKGLQNGSVKKYYKSGRIKSEYTCLNGLREGKRISFFENGNKKQDHYLVEDKVTGPVRDYYENGGVKYVSLCSKDSSFLFGEFDVTGKTVDKDYFFIDIITPDSVFMGKTAIMNITLYNTNIFEYSKLLKGEFIEGGDKIVVNERLKIIDNNIKIKLPTDKRGFNYWSGIIECTSKLDTTKFAPYPIYFSYYVRYPPPLPQASRLWSR